MAESINQQLHDVVQNILDESIPEKLKERLLKPLRRLKGGKPIAPARIKKGKKRKANNN